MKQVDIDYLDGEFTIQENEESTYAELEKLLGTQEAVCDEVTANLRYRNKYPRVYKAVSAALVDKHGFKRKVVDTKKNKDGTNKEILESENDHLRRFLKGEADDEGKVIEPAPAENREILAGLFQEIATAAPLYLEGEGRRGSGKISAAALELANKFFAQGTEKVEDVAAKIESNVPNYKVARGDDGAVTPESLARGISALQKSEEAKAKREANAKLGL